MVIHLLTSECYSPNQIKLSFYRLQAYDNLLVQFTLLLKIDLADKINFDQGFKHPMNRFHQSR